MRRRYLRKERKSRASARSRCAKSRSRCRRTCRTIRFPPAARAAGLAAGRIPVPARRTRVSDARRDPRAPTEGSSPDRARSGSGCAIRWLRARRRARSNALRSPPIRRTASARSSTSRRYAFVNYDLTIDLLRRPEGEWILVEAATLLGEASGGLAEARLCDATGLVGRATQSLALRHRE
ncbi:MAG: thioesterase family protein [Burkholderiales bacterium]|nr:thioesterase family protein [Burkholderiales bacterium]